MSNEGDENWKCGVCYVNVDVCVYSVFLLQDDRMCVPKRMGMGVTINFGKVEGVGLFVFLLAIPIISVLLICLFL